MLWKQMRSSTLCLLITMCHRSLHQPVCPVHSVTPSLIRINQVIKDRSKSGTAKPPRYNAIASLRLGERSPGLATMLFWLQRRPGIGLERYGCHRRLALCVFNLASRPGKIVGAAGWCRQRLTFDQAPHGLRISRHRPRSRTAEQLISAERGGHQRGPASGRGSG